MTPKHTPSTRTHPVIQSKKKAGGGKKITFRRRTMKFHKGKIWDGVLDYEEAMRRRPRRQEWLRAVKGLLGRTPEDQGWTYYYQVVKFNPTIRIWKNGYGALIPNSVRFGEPREDWSMEAIGMTEAVEVAIPETIQRAREYLLELKYILRHEGYNLESNQFELEEWDRSVVEHQVSLGFEAFEGLAKFKKD